MIGLSLLASVILFGIGSMDYTDALFFGAGASTQSGLNTYEQLLTQAESLTTANADQTQREPAVPWPTSKSFHQIAVGVSLIAYSSRSIYRHASPIQSSSTLSSYSCASTGSRSDSKASSRRHGILVVRGLAPEPFPRPKQIPKKVASLKGLTAGSLKSCTRLRNQMA